MLDQIISSVEPKMQKSLTYLNEQFNQIRGNRAQTGLVEGITVEIYGQKMLLKQVATLSTPDAMTVSIQPWDKSNIDSIEKAIRDTQSLGLNPSNDGNIIRINIPPLTEERRKQLVKIIAQKQEEAKVSLRNIRHDAINELHKKHKAGEISADMLAETEFKLKDKLNKLIEEYSEQIDQSYKQKEKEMLEI
jgi:ribosome recycling factor